MIPDRTVGRRTSSRIPHELREGPRIDVEADVTFSSEENFYQGFSENISEGGLFLVTYVTRRCGDVITVRFSLPGIEHPIEVRAEVRWLRSPDWDRGVNPGIGVRFIDLTDADRASIERFIARREPLFYDD